MNDTQAQKMLILLERIANEITLLREVTVKIDQARQQAQNRL